MKTSQEIIKLKQLVEDSIPRKIKTPADFVYLSGVIFERCGETISETTLKRIWGYIEGYDTTRFHTLSILAKFVGYNDWDDFVKENTADPNEHSEEIMQKCIYTKNLVVGDRIYFTWFPDRECLVEYQENNVFKVIEAQNSKLQKDDSFVCGFFIEGQPLYMDDLTRDGETYAMFVVGKNGGLKIVEKR
ncbi:MAG: hypothetical protein IIW55_02785 [Bacteroidales bacterium]|nr:hypothetical protein [Bacteroidales bacterium]